MTRSLAMGLGLLLTACSTYEGPRAQDSNDEASDTDPQVEDSGAPDTALTTPVWFGLDGSFELVEGRLVFADLSVRVYGELPEDGPICLARGAAIVAQDFDETPDPVVFHWWELQIEPQQEDCPPDLLLPERLRMGLGELHPGLSPGLEQAGLVQVADSIYGSYASFEIPFGDGLDGTTYAYGFAGREADRAGESPAASAGPLPDGLYLITAFYLFPTG